MPKYFFIGIVIYFFLPILPSNIYAQSIFLLAFSIIFLILGLFTHKLIKEIFINTLIRTIILTISVMIFSAFLIKLHEIIFQLKGVNPIESALLIALLAYIISISLFIMIEFLFKLLGKVVDPNEVKGKLEKIEAYASLGIACLAAFFIPNAVFGICYAIVFDTIHNINLSSFEQYYLSFVIDNALPLTNSNFINFINLINSNKLLSILQIIHISISKFLDLTVIAFLIKYINNILKNRRVLSK